VAATEAKRKKAPSAGEVARAYFKTIADRDVEAMMSHWEPGGYGYIYGMADLRAPDGYRQWFGALFSAFPDFLFEVTDMVAYGDKAAVRWRATGTFNGPTRFEGLTPNGARIELEGLDLLTIRDGLIRENRAYTNATEMARQLGAMPPAGSLGERALLGAVNARTAATGLARNLLDRD
jgi:predicted ester cyclase